MPANSENSDSGLLSKLFQTIGAIFAVVVAGPVLLVVTAFLLIVILFGGCMVAMAVVYPFTLADQQEQAADSRATAILEAQILDHPFPGDVETLIEADQWNFSPSGQYAIIRNNSQVTFVDVSSGAQQDVALESRIGLDSTVWLDDQRLFVFQSQSDITGYWFVLFVIRPGPNFSVEEVQLPAVRADKVADNVLTDKVLFQNDSPHSWEVVVVGQSGSQVIDAYSDEEREAFDQLMANQPVTKVSFYPDRTEWRPGGAVYAPNDSYYAAVWSGGSQLAIMQPEGDIVAAVKAADFAPPAGNCHLQPIRWLPESDGVLFAAACGRITKAILKLPISND